MLSTFHQGLHWLVDGQWLDGILASCKNLPRHHLIIPPFYDIVVTTFNLEQRKLLKQTIIQLCDHKNLICDRLFSGHMLQKKRDKDLWIESAIDHSLVLPQRKSSVMHPWWWLWQCRCIIPYFLTKVARCHRTSRGEIDTIQWHLTPKLAKTWFYWCCPVWHWRENT